MEKKLVLNTDETIIRRSQEIGYGSTLSRSNNELILTSQAVILMKKNLFGKVSDIIRFPLSDIVISNNQAQVRLGQKDIVTPTLDIYFKTGLESFRFQWEDEVKEWANQINALLTGQAGLYKSEDWVAELTEMSDAFNGAVRSAKKVLGIKSTEQASCKCPACGASITGTVGETIRCPYCGSYYTFE